jgi:hypothetical protein
MIRWKELQKETVYRGRFTPAGRGLLTAAGILAQPIDWSTRLRAARRYNAQHPSAVMTRAEGSAVLPSGSIPGTAEIVALCRRLYESKQEQLAAVPTAKRGKGTFLRNALNDDDLKANPQLVDFALSDPLFSIVTNYFGVIPTLNRVDLVHSIARDNADGHISSQVFHQDHEGVRQAKVFLNIFDVGDEHGPFTWYPTSDSDRILTAIRRQRRQAGAAQVGHYGDEEVIAQAGHPPRQLKGPAGSAVVVDTSRCLHAGSRVSRGHFRLCLYLQYCTSREKANAFDAARFRNDPVRWLAIGPNAAHS